MGNSPHLCTVTLSLPGGGNKIGHDHEGAVPLEVRGRGRARQGSELGEEPGERQHGPSQPPEPTGPPAASTFMTSEWGDVTRLHLSLVHGETEAQRERQERGWVPNPALSLHTLWVGGASPQSAHLCWEDVVGHIPDLGAQAWELCHSQTFEFNRHTADEAA